MAYSKTTWVNNSTPAINDTNLNKMETGIDEAHDAIDNVTTGHDHDGTDSKKVTAGNVVNVAAGTIVATDAQGAIDELDTEKVAKATFDANTVLAADTDDTPAAVTVAEQTIVGRITAGNIKALSVGEAQTLINVENGADVTDATNVNTAGAVMETDYNAHTILAATADNTPLPITISASRFIGRTAASDIEDLSAAEALVILGVEAGADVTDSTNVAAAGAVMDADFTAVDEVMVGSGAGTHSQVTLAASEFVAKKAAGSVTNVSAADARTILNVADGADNTPDANTTTKGKVELAIVSEVNTGTDTTRTITPDALAGSIFGTKNIIIKCISDTTTLTTGDEKARLIIPIEFDGMNLVSVGGHIYAVSSSGTPTFQIYNHTKSNDMLSTLLTIDVGEYDTKTAAAPPIINTANDHVSDGDLIWFNCDIAGTGASGMEIRMGFRLP